MNYSLPNHLSEHLMGVLYTVEMPLPSPDRQTRQQSRDSSWTTETLLSQSISKELQNKKLEEIDFNGYTTPEKLIKAYNIFTTSERIEKNSQGIFSTNSQNGLSLLAQY